MDMDMTALRRTAAALKDLIDTRSQGLLDASDAATRAALSLGNMPASGCIGWVHALGRADSPHPCNSWPALMHVSESRHWPNVTGWSKRCG